MNETNKRNWPHYEVLRRFIPRGRRTQFGQNLGVTKATVDAWCGGWLTPTAEMCVKIEVLTFGRLTRRELRPDVFGDLEAG